MSALETTITVIQLHAGESSSGKLIAQCLPPQVRIPIHKTKGSKTKRYHCMVIGCKYGDHDGISGSAFAHHFFRDHVAFEPSGAPIHVTLRSKLSDKLQTYDLVM